MKPKQIIDVGIDITARNRINVGGKCFFGNQGYWVDVNPDSIRT